MAVLHTCPGSGSLVHQATKISNYNEINQETREKETKLKPVVPHQLLPVSFYSKLPRGLHKYLHLAGDVASLRMVNNF